MESNETLLAKTTQDLSPITQEQAHLLHLLFLAGYNLLDFQEDIYANFTDKQIQIIQNHLKNRIQTLTEITGLNFDK
jgi:phosphoribosyl-ATP pyrophosphohydrolase